jgi:hypothetical protein
MLDTWPMEDWYGGSDDQEDADKSDEVYDVAADPERSQLARFFVALTKLRDESRIVSAFELLRARRGHDKTDNDAILGAAALFPPKRSARMIEEIVVNHVNDALAPCCALLNAGIAGLFAEKPKYFVTAVKSLLASLPGDPSVAPIDVVWGHRRHVAPSAGVVADLVRLTEAVDVALAKQLAEHLLAWPNTYSLDRALVPAVKRLLDGGAQKSGPAMTSLYAACLAHLEARAAKPLEPHKDWSRASNIQCACEHCAALNRFLADPTNETWTLKAPERVRGHVEGEIKAAGADLDTRTERRGSPHSLVCQKNSASHDRPLHNGAKT